MKDVTGNVIHKKEGASSNAFGFHATKDGPVEYCFSNQKATVGNKVVAFSVRGPDEKSKLETKYKMNDGTLMRLLCW